MQAPHTFQPSLTPPYNQDDQKLDGSCSAQRDQRGSDDIFPMSRLPVGGSRSQQTTRPSPIQSYPGMQPPQRGSPREGTMNHHVLPPLRQFLRTPPTPSDRRHGNPLHSFINPQAKLVEQQRSRGRSRSQLEIPSPIYTQSSHSLPSISRPTSVDSTSDEHQPRLFPPSMGRTSTRHILTRKPHIFNPPTGTIEAHQTPFLTASARPSGLALSHQSLPTPPAGTRASYFPPLSNAGSASPQNMILSNFVGQALAFLSPELQARSHSIIRTASVT
jgi:hypothetical protein